MESYKNKSTTSLHIQDSHKNAKLKATMYSLETWYRPVLALSLLLQTLWVSFLWTLLTWFRGPWSPSVPLLLWLLNHADFSSTGFLELGEGFDGDLPLRTVCSKVSLCSKYLDMGRYIFPMSVIFITTF